MEELNLKGHLSVFRDIEGWTAASCAPGLALPVQVKALMQLNKASLLPLTEPLICPVALICYTGSWRCISFWCISL